jgi:hypothetical protein
MDQSEIIELGQWEGLGMQLHALGHRRLRRSTSTARAPEHASILSSLAKWHSKIFCHSSICIEVLGKSHK